MLVLKYMNKASGHPVSCHEHDFACSVSMVQMPIWVILLIAIASDQGNLFELYWGATGFKVNYGSSLSIAKRDT